MPFTETLAQTLCVVDSLAPQTKTDATTNGTAVDMLYWGRLLYVLTIGTNATSVAFKLQGSKDGTTNFDDLTGFGITTILVATKMAKVGIKAEDLGTNYGTNGPYRYVRYVLTTVGAAVVSVIALGSVGRYKPESSFNQVATVAQTISD